MGGWAAPRGMSQESCAPVISSYLEEKKLSLMRPRSIVRWLCPLVLGACATNAPAPAPAPAVETAKPLEAKSAELASPPTPVEAPAPPPPAAPTVRTLGRCADASSDVAHITLAHLNDLQARYSDRLAGKSRYGYIAGYLRALKDEVPETLVVDAGDDYEKGAVAELRSMGEATRQMVQALPIDVRTIGNHDFAYGEDAVVKDVSESAHPVLAANIRYEKKPDLFAPFVRIDVGCVRVGVVGVVASNYGADDLPTREPFDGVFVHDDHYVDIVGQVVRAHRAEVDVMIAVDHIGLFPDSVLAQKTPGLDVVVGGHTEDLVRKPLGVWRRDGSRAVVLQAGHWGRTLGRADLTIDLKKKRVTVDHYAIVDVTPSLPFADDVGDLAEKLEAEAAPDAHKSIATVKKPIGRGAPMAELVWRAARAEWKADAMVVGRDVFWTGLASGPVTLQDLYDTVLVQREPAGTSGFTSLHLVHVTGAELLAARRRFAGGRFAFYGPTDVDAKKMYAVVLEKRPFEVPSSAFVGGVSAFTGKSEERGGEVIDLLEAYAHTQTAAGKTLD